MSDYSVSEHRMAEGREHGSGGSAEGEGAVHRQIGDVQRPVGEVKGQGDEAVDQPLFRRAPQQDCTHAKTSKLKSVSRNYLTYLETSTPIAAAVSGFTTVAYSLRTCTGTSETGLPERTSAAIWAVCFPSWV